MSAPSPIKRLAINIIEDLSLNAPLPAVEERVWMLKTRHMSDAQVRDIISAEFGGEGDSTATDPAIVVEHLPEEYDRASWR